MSPFLFCPFPSSLLQQYFSKDTQETGTKLTCGKQVFRQKNPEVCNKMRKYLHRDNMPDFSSVKEQTKMWFTVRISLLVPLIEKKNLYTNQGYSQIILLELGKPFVLEMSNGIYIILMKFYSKLCIKNVHTPHLGFKL